MTCQQDSACISWSVNPLSGSPSAAPIISVQGENDVGCTASGLFVPKGLQVANCATFPAVAQLGQPVGLLQAVVDSGALVLTNPTDDRVMNVMVHINFGAVRMVCSTQVVPAVTDYAKYATEGNVAAFQPFDQITTYSIEDGNTTDLAAQTIITFPGASIPFVVCPSVPAGESVEVRYQRTLSVSGLVGGLADFLLQPTVVSMWGLVV